ncbi:MAG: metallophosphoesterase [Ectothiorhodospiraceae bacterium]|nr:metallophosphoesterase [Ectothiorhodospiraceae bacterium]
MPEPGRTCPLSYRTRPEDLDAAASFRTQTLYVVGGLYGNVDALSGVLALVDEEKAAGLPEPDIVFNGDFNWFNVEPSLFREVNATVLAHRAILGNVELELVDPAEGAGCGCAYPPWVDQPQVDRSNQIMERLRAAAQPCEGLFPRLAALPRQMRVDVGDVRVGILHGDPESTAGWGLALEVMPDPGTINARIADWFRRAEVDVFACTHTCTAYMQDFPFGDGRLIMNNGAAGMPNFRGDPRGHITRISRVAAPFGIAYGRVLKGVHCAAVPVAWKPAAWLRRFDTLWPAGSPAAMSYRRRLVSGPEHSIRQACRLAAAEATTQNYGRDRPPGLLY